MGAFMGWLALGMGIVIALLCVFYNSVFYGNVLPQVAGAVYETMGDGGGVAELGTASDLGGMSMWGRVVMPAVAIIIGGLIWYRECISKGRNDENQYR